MGYRKVTFCPQCNDETGIDYHFNGETELAYDRCGNTECDWENLSTHPEWDYDAFFYDTEESPVTMMVLTDNSDYGKIIYGPVHPRNGNRAWATIPIGQRNS